MGEKNGTGILGPSTAMRVLTQRTLLRQIVCFQSGMPFEVGVFAASLEAANDVKVGTYRGKLPQFAVRRRDNHMLELLRRATLDPQLRQLPPLQFYGVQRCAVQYNSLHVLQWLHATRHNSPTLQHECRLLSTAVGSYFDSVEMLEWLHSSPDGPHEAVETVTLPEVCRAAGLGNVQTIRWLHEHGSAAFSPLVMDTAAAHGHLELVRFLHEHRDEGCSSRAMHGAALNGYHQVVAFLAQHRHERVDARTLEMAASGGRLQCVQTLCRLATPPIGGWQLGKARQRAQEAGHLAVARFLIHQQDSSRVESTWVEHNSPKKKRRYCCGIIQQLEALYLGT